MYKRILVSVDGSPTADKALCSAIGLAKELNAQLQVLHAMDYLPYFGAEPYGNYYADSLNALRDAGEAILAEAVARAKSSGVAVESKLDEQLAAPLGEVVAQAAIAWHADLIVVGTHGRRGVGRLLMGSGAEQIIRLAPVPVLVVRAEAPAATDRA